MKLKAKVLILILSTSVLIFVATIGYVSVLFKNKALSDATKLADTYAREYANLVTAELNVDADLSRTLAHSFLGYQVIEPQNRKTIYNEMLKNIFIENLGYLAVWTSFELKAFHEGYTADHGRARSEVHRFYDRVVVSEDTLDLVEENISGTYASIKQTKQETMTDPYFYSYTKKKEDEILMASICVPIVQNNEFIGLSGVDIGLDRFQKITDDIQPFEQSSAFFLAFNGRFVAHPNPKYINKSLDEVNFPGRFENNLMENIQNGKHFSYMQENEDGTVNYVSFAPVIVGKTITPWAIGIVVPVDVIMAEANSNFLTSVLVSLFGLIILTIVTLFTTMYITRPLQRITHILKMLAIGDVKESYKMRVTSTDEIGEIRHSVNSLIDGLLRTAKFATNIGKGNLNAEFDMLSDKDVLGKALLDMRLSLTQAREEESKRKEVDKQVNWATEGMAKFGNILRQDNNDLEKLSNNIVSNLVNYLNAVQGAMFIINDDDETDKYFQMTAAYAYDRKRFAEKRIEMNEGLIGRCNYEKQSIYLIDIPENHVSITSGLGDSNPRSLLIVPLKLNDEIYGVIEVSSYNKFDAYQIEFTEKIGESIASTISSVKINMQTAFLLQQSQEQAEEMSAQEEELRQNMEEMQAIQEEMSRKSEEQESEINKLIAENETKIVELAEKELAAKAILNALNSTTYLVEYDFDGTILYANDYVSKLFDSSPEEMIGMKHSDNMSTDTMKDSTSYRQFWFDLKSGKTKNEISCYEVNGEQLWLSETYTPVFDNEGNPYKVLKISHDITKDKLREEVLERHMAELDAEKELSRQNIEKNNKKYEKQEEKLRQLITEKDAEIERLLQELEEGSSHE